ncbi:MAG TPA: tetratricopeptide repeat protein, partial [Rhizomicrobium sp.]|nr:tetratricopeptide repeat protein [Rhizomicrobium sp.]
PDMADAQFELGTALHKCGVLTEAENTFRGLLKTVPGHGPALLGLGAVLLDLGRAEEAEGILAPAIAASSDPRLLSRLHYNLAIAQRRLRKFDLALVNFEQAQKLDPAQRHLDLARAETLQDLRRSTDALAVYRQVLSRDPLNAAAHDALNNLLYRLGMEDEFLASYDRAPKAPDLQIAKANFLAVSNRSPEAYAVFSDLRANQPGNSRAAGGAAAMLTRMGRHDEAAALFEAAIARDPDNYDLIFGFSAALLRRGDPDKAAHLAERGLGLVPADQLGLALLGTAWRMMGSGQDEALNGYDSLIQIFDLAPPEGFSDMETFNAALASHLDELHPPTREYVNQSLRGGSQTSGSLFGTGQALVEKLQIRIREAVTRYVAELLDDPSHPFLSRRRNGIQYSGSWSSRLLNGGYHTNHIHRGGWISSCYYVRLPPVVTQAEGKQGWITFGQPDFDNGPGVRRAIQPVPGRLVLFPSYIWHGTLPFESETPRTTIAFDALPV